MKRLSDQVLILEAIGNVRRELKPQISGRERIDVMVRLATLYSLLDVSRLKRIVEQMDTRSCTEYNNKGRKVA